MNSEFGDEGKCHKYSELLQINLEPLNERNPNSQLLKHGGRNATQVIYF